MTAPDLGEIRGDVLVTIRAVLYVAAFAYGWASCRMFGHHTRRATRRFRRWRKKR